MKDIKYLVQLVICHNFLDLEELLFLDEGLYNGYKNMGFKTSPQESISTSV